MSMTKTTTTMKTIICTEDDRINFATTRMPPTIQPNKTFPHPTRTAITICKTTITTPTTTTRTITTKSDVASMHCVNLLVLITRPISIPYHHPLLHRRPPLTQLRWQWPRAPLPRWTRWSPPIRISADSVRQQPEVRMPPQIHRLFRFSKKRSFWNRPAPIHRCPAYPRPVRYRATAG